MRDFSRIKRLPPYVLGIVNDLKYEARKKGDYNLADTLRKELEENGVIIEDKQDKTKWKYK